MESVFLLDIKISQVWDKKKKKEKRKKDGASDMKPRSMLWLTEILLIWREASPAVFIWFQELWHTDTSVLKTAFVFQAEMDTANGYLLQPEKIPSSFLIFTAESHPPSFRPKEGNWRTKHGPWLHAGIFSSSPLHCPIFSVLQPKFPCCTEFREIVGEAFWKVF